MYNGRNTWLNNQANSNSAAELNIIAIIPVRGKYIRAGDKNLLDYTLKRAQESKFIKQVFVSTDNAETALYAKSKGACAPFLRPSRLSEDYVDIGTVLAYSLDQIEKEYGVPDLVVLLDQTYPFRSVDLIDK